MSTSEEVKLKIPFGGKFLDAAYTVPIVPHTHGVIFTHGAGGDMNFHQLVSMASFLACNGILCLRFTCKGLNLNYRIRAYRAVMEHVKSSKEYEVKSWFLGGRSMGSRAAACIIRQCKDSPDEGLVDGLICLSFPLHPPKQQSKLRTDDLLLVHYPVLFVSGSLDEMCEKSVLERVLNQMPVAAEVHWVEGASHGMEVKQRAREDIMTEINTKVLSWIQKILQKR
ncbi:testis-expressed protein 30 [Callorhinchus milii]|uniref:KANL3/Tex30 alpha/beta hydrolase-like domain-containing protein n=1 Tax=Callorhinchus milii TaxID=7868 RepID=A0A4W3HQ59_CALMI|nr:testis-expressed protein 30 [Callorhinchus milii]|eukprot:gi/632948713/ref/XP_007889754.1/ PREDICTED: testis-expressed sequence 30 protein [Callorhinchus milii]